MSFWKKAGELAKKAGTAILEEAKATSERANEYSLEMRSKSDSELARIVNIEMKRSPLKASSAYKELKARGYDTEQIKKM